MHANSYAEEPLPLRCHDSVGRGCSTDGHVADERLSVGAAAVRVGSGRAAAHPWQQLPDEGVPLGTRDTCGLLVATGPRTLRGIGGHTAAL